MLVQLLLVLYSANVEADNYAAYDKYSQGIVDHAGAAAQYHNTGNTEAASTPPRLFYNFRLLSPFFSLLLRNPHHRTRNTLRNLHRYTLIGAAFGCVCVYVCIAASPPAVV